MIYFGAKNCNSVYYTGLHCEMSSNDVENTPAKDGK